jgi:hypothetical protein
MGAAAQRPRGTTGIVRIVRQALQGDRARSLKYRISFGGSKDPGGASYLGMAFGTEDLIHLLTRIGVSEAGAEMAARALASQSEYDICGVTPPPRIASSPGRVRWPRLEAVHDADTADVREESLYFNVCERLERGKLPRAPKMVRVGKATHDRTCIVCQRVIRPGQMLNESITDDGPKEFTHTLCLRAWADVSRTRKGSETVS